MIAIEQTLKGNLDRDLDTYAAHIQGEVLLSGVAAMARVIYDEVKLNTSGARAHAGRPGDPPESRSGKLDAAIYRVYSKEQSTEGRQVYKVSVNKTKAPHWALVEYGTSRAPAHPYIRPAFDKMGAAIEAGKVRMRERAGNLGNVEIES